MNEKFMLKNDIVETLAIAAICLVAILVHHYAFHDALFLMLTNNR